MNYEDIILLVKAGYTRDQIAAMQTPPAPAKTQTPPAPPAPEKTQTPPAPPATANTQTPPAPPATANTQTPPAPPVQSNTTEIGDLVQMLSAEFAKLNAAIVKANLQQAQQPPQETVDDILASIINPPQKSSGK